MPTYTDLKRYGDHVLGGTLVLVFLVASLMADLYGVSAVMDNTYSIWNQWLIAGGCVLIKASGFYKMRSAWREGCVSAAIAMGALTVIVLVVSITNEMTYYQTNFADKSTHLGKQVAISSDAAKEKAAIEDRLAKTTDVRPPTAIEGDITAALARRVRGDKNDRTIGDATESCTARKHWAYDQCASVLALRAELANAVVVTPQIEKDRARLDAIRASKAWVSSVGEVHPGVDLLGARLQPRRRLARPRRKAPHYGGRSSGRGCCRLHAGAAVAEPVPAVRLVLPAAGKGTGSNRSEAIPYCRPRTRWQ
jgi:hypothetical protein